MAAGLEPGDAPERLNLDHPETVHGLHESYVNAGSDIVLTNTFGGSRLRLKLHKLDDRHRDQPRGCPARPPRRRPA